MICQGCGGYTSWKKACTSCGAPLPHPSGPVDEPYHPGEPGPMPGTGSMKSPYHSPVSETGYPGIR